MCKDPINPKLPHWRRTQTKALQVLHKFTQKPNSIGAMVVGTGNIISFTPTRPFKCSNILIWYSKQLVIKQITIGPMEQLTMALPGIALAAPVTLKVIEGWFVANVLRMMFSEHHVYPLELSVADPTHPIKIEFEGEFDIIALYGAQIV